MDVSRFRTLAKNWDAFGQRDPLFGVLSDPTKQHGRWDVRDFFESGQAHVAKLFRILEEHGVAVEHGRALDFGCGVGRLTRPIAERFEQTIGVDVAPSMIALARRENPLGERCRFVLNRRPDLSQLASGTFDFVHSCLVLQHIPPTVTRHYIAEFFRVTRRGGLVVFQVPAQTFTDEQINARLALPQDAYRADLAAVRAPAVLEAGRSATVVVAVANRGDATWLQDIPGGRHLCIANHWLTAGGGVAVSDDGRVRLPHDLAPGQSTEVQLDVVAPAKPGDYLLEIDLVQERICWFAERGSPTARVPIVVRPVLEMSGAEAQEAAASRSAAGSQLPDAALRREGMLARIRRRLRAPAPFFEMHVVPRADVEQAVAQAGGSVLNAIDDGAAGAGWLSYTYLCRRRA